MLFSHSPPRRDALRQKISAAYLEEEEPLVRRLLEEGRALPLEWQKLQQQTRRLVESLRENHHTLSPLQALLQEYSLSTQEGAALMCLAEALLRTPDSATRDLLISDRLSQGNWAAHRHSGSLLVNASAWALKLGERLSRRAVTDGQAWAGLGALATRLGQPLLRQALHKAITLLAEHFVLAPDMARALQKAQAHSSRGYRYAFDMLGEGARTLQDADRYLSRYLEAIEVLGQHGPCRDPLTGPGISVKLSALFPRFEFGQRARVMAELLPRLYRLARQAKIHNLGLTVDAEEAERLELSLDIIAALCEESSLAGWDGFGFAVQAYQKRALQVIEWAAALARRSGRKLMIRLVKGAYWDREIKQAQLLGLADYPVFTRKAATDLNYLLCARQLLAEGDVLCPQFATHNAQTVAGIVALCGEAGRGLADIEFQRLHGMGEALFERLRESQQLPCRIYAPVGEHSDLLAYLVRRLLENGANSSFVFQLQDRRVPLDQLLQDPLSTLEQAAPLRHPRIPLPEALYYDREGTARRSNSQGLELSDLPTLQALDRDMEAALQQLDGSHSALQGSGEPWRVSNPACAAEQLSTLRQCNATDIATRTAAAHSSLQRWQHSSGQDRARLLHRLGNALQAQAPRFVALCIKEGGRTLNDALAEVREAVDFCRYYGNQALETGSEAGRRPRGVVLCISPWNFPLAIFLGQVSAALAAGNTVLAKPAQQGSLVALAAVELLYDCGLPQGVVQLLLGPGRPVGEQLCGDPRIQGVLFTGSWETALWLARALSQREDNIPLVAETGGINAMIVDATALPEQVVDDVIASGFRSAGQRCSALRLLCLQEDIADSLIAMLIGAMKELRVGDPALLSTDIGPLIDHAALARIESYLQRRLRPGSGARLLYQGSLSHLDETRQAAPFCAPTLIELQQASLLQEEIFGPVVHVVRYRGGELDTLVEQINASGYGLTFGVHSRIQCRYERLARAVKAGNVYVNRNMIGAVVGVQPFGGCGRSGTGPKAGGPAYVPHLTRPRDTPALQALAPLQWQPGSATAPRSLKALSACLPGWQGLALAERRVAIDSVLTGLNPAQLPQRDKAAIEALLSSVLAGHRDNCRLPGPTGERNTYWHEPRGIMVVVFQRHRSAAEALGQSLAALLLGNGVVVVCQDADDRVFHGLAAALEGSGVARPLLQLEDFTALAALLENKGIDGVLLSRSCRSRKALLARVLANPKGLIPVVAVEDEGDLLRACTVEKTLSVNTTAQGGNAALMSLSDSGP